MLRFIFWEIMLIQSFYLQISRKVLNYIYAGVAQRQSSGIVNRRLGVQFPSPALNNLNLSTLQINKNVLNYMYYRMFLWGYSSVGRVLEWHSRGQEFETPYLHTLRV